MAMQIDHEHVEKLRRSIALVGPISTDLVDQNGRKLSGRHRDLADKDKVIQTQVIQVKNPYHRELIILLSNVQRQASEEELKFRMNRIATEFWILNKCKEEEVCAGICKDLAPEEGPKVYSQRRIEQLLEPRWKSKTIPGKVETISTSTVLLPERAKKIKEVTTALDLQNTDSEDPRPFKDCYCNECPHMKKECY